MPDIFIGLGANLDPGKNIRKALGLLRLYFNEITCSPVYQNAAVGFDGPPFINLVARFHSSTSAIEVQVILKQIEHQCGRTKESKRFTSRTMDIDLLLFGDQISQDGGIHVPRNEILQHAYVLKPLADLYPQGLHPVSKERFIDLWQAMEKCIETSLLAVRLQNIA
ncbi:MAG TPA: 2-amino-4-hydroxy-6-hydroxymethyldihydropteridine diphosphokinase [Gammaproteobacteria bacterium]|nr:2-amino-4-hydroxy-6-hydroxymethyldihydropteridine diphosphokinase [Gammaproteobacteria bacterium]